MKAWNRKTSSEERVGFSEEEVQKKMLELQEKLNASEDRANKAEAEVAELRKKYSDGVKPADGAKSEVGLRDVQRLADCVDEAISRANKAEAEVAELRKKYSDGVKPAEAKDGGSEIAALRQDVGRLAELLGTMMSDKERTNMAVDQYIQAVETVQCIDQRRKKTAGVLKEMRAAQLPK